jgi:hypothetical protein
MWKEALPDWWFLGCDSARELEGRAIAENCAILCKECYLGITKIRRENKTYVIPDTDLLFLNG